VTDYFWMPFNPINYADKSYALVDSEIPSMMTTNVPALRKYPVTGLT